MGFLIRPQDMSEYKGNRMNAMKALACLLPVLFAAGGSYADADHGESKVTDRKVSVVGFVDAGQVVKGSLVIDDGGSDPLKLSNAFLNRNGIALTYSGTLNENLHMNIGVGGLFWKPLPENTNVGSKRIQFGPGISEASAQYDFSSALSVKFGFFGYKYNPEAVNLGEYLLRSEAYPTIIHTGSTGGWVWMNSNEYKSMGAKLTWDMLGGALRHDVLLFSEFNEAPIFDFSPSYVATAKLGKAFEIGAGFSLHRWLPIKPSQTTPTSTYNTYVKWIISPPSRPFTIPRPASFNRVLPGARSRTSKTRWAPIPMNRRAYRHRRKGCQGRHRLRARQRRYAPSQGLHGPHLQGRQGDGQGVPQRGKPAGDGRGTDRPLQGVRGAGILGCRINPISTRKSNSASRSWWA